MTTHIAAAYSRRAAEYARDLGSMASVHPSDRHLVTEWARQLDGPVVDAGCGPGHWTGYLSNRGLDARGVDQVSALIEHARRTYPGVPFEVGNLDALPVASGIAGGVLAWYSLIHHEPAAIQTPLAEFARVLRPGGGLLLGFFCGPKIEQFEHAVVSAFRWPLDALGFELHTAGFEVVETHTRTGPGYRPHGAIVARLPL